jgi:hypothetical protein
MKKVFIIIGVIVIILSAAFFYLQANLGGGGGANHYVPDIATTTKPIEIMVVLTTWGGGGKISGRYTDTSLHYRLVGEDVFNQVNPTPAPLPENYKAAMERDKSSQYTALSFIIPAYPVGTVGEVEYYVDTTLDGHFNHQNGIKTIKLID